MDILATVTIQLATVIAAVWGLTEAMASVAKRRNWTWYSKPIFALLLGPLFGMAAFAFGFLTTLPLTEGWKGYGGAAFAGCIAVGASNAFAKVIAIGRESFKKGD